MSANNLLSHREIEPEKGVLYVVGTPIGNLNDLSFRAINILKNVSLVACEDTRQTAKIMQKYEIKNQLISFNKHNSFNKIPLLIEKLKSDKSIALVSDAGMPGICDPGEDLIKNSKLSGIDIICIPGPCAAITALVSSGFPSSSFIFEGFLPRQKNEREEKLFNISNNEKTTILFESPYRLKKLLNDLMEFCGEDREIEVFRELTKKFEENIGNNLKKVVDYFQNKEIIGEITIVIKGVDKKKESELNSTFLKKELYELVNAGLSLSSASKYLAKKNNLPKNLIYKLY
jgi:16S rRNA (cytidine1402-2'-O)-methyltransferase